MRLSLRDLKPKHIQEYYQYKYTSGRLDNKPGGLSIPSIKKHGIVIKEVLDDAVLEELIVRNPGSRCETSCEEPFHAGRSFFDIRNRKRSAEGIRWASSAGACVHNAVLRSEAFGSFGAAVEFD